ncbi:hypothetical protein ACOMHN_043173 [Nucella lapillus]
MAGVPESSARLACDFVIAGTSLHSPSETLDSLVDDDICKHLRRCFFPGRGRPPALPKVQLTNRLLLQLKLLQAEGKKSSKDVSKWFDMLFPDVSYPSTRLSGALDRLEKKVQAVQREDGDIDSFLKTEVDFDFVSSSLSKADANVAASQCGKVISIVGQHLFNVDLKEEDLPKLQTCINIADEGHFLAKFQATETILAADNVTLHTDGTSRGAHKIVGQQITLDSGATLYLGLNTVATEDSETLLEVTIQMLQELSDVYAAEETNDRKEEVFNAFLTKLTSCMSDRAAVMKLFSTKLSDFLQSTLGQEVTLHFLKCNAHFLLGLSRSCETSLKTLEEEMTEQLGRKLGRDTHQKFQRFRGNERATAQVIRLASSLLGPRGDEKNGCRAEWLAFLKNKSLLTSYRSGDLLPPLIVVFSSTLPDWLWVQCEQCLKWRRMPDAVRTAPLPDLWLCYMNPDPTHNRCEIPEEPEDEDEAVSRASYAKTFKKKLEEKKRKKQADIAAKEEELKARERALLEAQKQQEMTPAEVSSSEQNQDIAWLQRALLDARKREEDHKRLIVKIQFQKKQVEDQHNSLMEAARNLRSAQTTSTDQHNSPMEPARNLCSPQTTTSELLDVASALTGDSPVSSTSSQHAGQKRRFSGEEGGGLKKVMNLTTDQGDTVTIEKAYSDEDDDAEDLPLRPDTPTSPDDTSAIPSIVAELLTPAPINVAKQPTPTASKAAKQETSTDSRQPTSSPKKAARQTTTSGSASKQLTSTPKQSGSGPKSSPRRAWRARRSSAKSVSAAANDGVIDLTFEEDELENGNTAAKTTTTTTPSTETQDVKPDMDELQQQMQTESRAAKKKGKSTKGGGTGESSSNGNTKVKTEDDGYLSHLQQKHKLLSCRFRNLQRNVHKLLSFIVPDVDLGPEEDIEHIVTEMIRVNCNQTLANQSQASQDQS